MANLGQLKSNLDNVIKRWYDEVKDIYDNNNPTLNTELLESITIKPYTNVNGNIGLDLDTDILKMNFTAIDYKFSWVNESDNPGYNAADTSGKLTIFGTDTADSAIAINDTIFSNYLLSGVIDAANPGKHNTNILDLTNTVTETPKIPLSGIQFTIGESTTPTPDTDVHLEIDLYNRNVASGGNNDSLKRYGFKINPNLSSGKLKKYVYDTDTSTGSYQKIGTGVGENFKPGDTLGILIDNTFTQFLPQHKTKNNITFPTTNDFVITYTHSGGTIELTATGAQADIGTLKTSLEGDAYYDETKFTLSKDGDKLIITEVVSSTSPIEIVHNSVEQEFDTTYEDTGKITSDSITKVVYLRNGLKIDEEYILTETTSDTFAEYKILGHLQLGIKVKKTPTTNMDISNMTYIFGSDVSLNYMNFTNIDPSLQLQ